jgi:hypothetical protein
MREREESMPPAVKVTPWERPDPPTVIILSCILHGEGLSFYDWANGPNELYLPHTHPYHKVIYVVSGSITFILPETSERHTLHSGDRLDLPAGVLHSAVVGPQGVTCLEGHRSLN